jgi:hypothetical protein
MAVRDHAPIVIENFNGLWDRGDEESCPSDHFIVADNVQYLESGIETRYPLNKWQANPPNPPIGKVIRLYNYVMQTGQSLLVMIEGGWIYHLIGPNVQHGPIAYFPTATDFAFVSIAGKAYISPFKTHIDATGQTYELGLENEKVWVYNGSTAPGTPARITGGVKPTNGGLKPFIIFNDINDGTITKGIHFMVIVFRDATGPQLYEPGAVQMVDAPGNLKVQLTNIPLGPTGTVSRDIVMTKSIDPKDIEAGAAGWYIAHNIPDNSTTDFKLDIADDKMTVGAGWVGANPNAHYMACVNSSIKGFSETGFHLFAVVYETDTGYLTQPGPEFFCGNTFVNVRRQVQIYNLPTTTDPTIKKRHIIATKTITEYNGDQRGYQFFFVPGAVINNANIDTGISFSMYDSDLISDASHLLDNYESIPAGVALSTYHSRMVVVGLSTVPDPPSVTPHDPDLPVVAPHADLLRPDNRSVALISAPGEPEAISKVDGLIVTPLDGSPLTNAQEFRDILYLFKKTRTYAYSDNFDVPSSWVEEVLDQGIGAPVHGIGTVLDSGGVNTDFLLIVDWSGLMLFNGTYSRPELTFKVEDFWYAQNRNGFHSVQIANDSIGKKIYITLPVPHRNFILYADYSNGLDAKNIKWSKWVFDGAINSICLMETNRLIIGATYND